MSLADITYVSEPDQAFTRGLDKAKTPEALTEHLAAFRWLFPDAYDAGCNLSNTDFLLFRSGLRKERKGEFAGEEYYARFAAVLLPENAMHIGAVAQHFGAPFGLALLRMKEAGALVEKNGIVVVSK